MSTETLAQEKEQVAKKPAEDLLSTWNLFSTGHYRAA